MKVNPKYRAFAWSGKLEGMIYYQDGRSGQMLARRAFKHKNHPAQGRFAQIVKQIYGLQPSQAYRRDLQRYCTLYQASSAHKAGPGLGSWSAAYSKLMWELQNRYPQSVNLTSITREQIYTELLPCRSVKDAVEAGLLPIVPGWESWDALL